MSASLVKTLKASIVHLIQFCGYALVRLEDLPFNAFFSNLRRVGYKPSYIFDVGANCGQWTRRSLSFFPKADYVLFEPQDHLQKHVEDLISVGRVRWINVGVGSVVSKMPFHIRKRDDSSTFYTDVLAGDAKTMVTEIAITTLNAFVKSNQNRIPELVKIDAEGLDLEVLEGSSDLFGKTEIFLVEAAVCSPLYPNTVKRVLDKMAAAGYALCDITDLNRGESKCLWLIEIAFVREEGELISRLRQF